MGYMTLENLSGEAKPFLRPLTHPPYLWANIFILEYKKNFFSVDPVTFVKKKMTIIHMSSSHLSLLMYGDAHGVPNIVPFKFDHLLFFTCFSD